MLTSRLLALVCLGPSMAVSNAWAGDLHVPTDYPTVQSAIHAAAAGDVIRLAPGTYQGTVVVEKGGISIVGAGAESTALVSDGAPWAVVVSSCGLGEADLVRLVGCRIRGIGGGGVVAGGSRLVVQDCVVADSPDVALQANDAARVLASRCEFAGNGYGAKQGGADTELRLTDSVLTANTYGACAVGSGGRLVAERCTVSGNHAGVFIYAAGRCALTDCSVSSNAWVGVAMGGYGGPGGCDLDVAGGEIASNGSDGITCADGSRVTIGQGVATSGTRMTANGQSAIACSGGSTATVVDAELSGSPWAGVSCEGASHASLEDCRLAGNYAGIWANGESSVAADRCTVADSDYYGAACLAGSTLSLRSSTLEGAPFGAYFSLATGEVTGSTLAGNAVYGIVCSGSSPLLANNTVEGNGYAGILNTADWGPDFEPGTADDGPLANPRISGNTIGGNAGGGIANYDTRPANADTLAADNTFGDDNGPFRIAQLWLGRARVVSGGVGVDGAAVTAMDAAGRIVTLVTGAGGYSSWGWFTQYRVYNDSAREDMNPYTVTASSGSTNRTVTYAWDGLPKPYGADVNGRYQTAIVELGAPPAITDVTGPAAPVSVGATVSAQARFTDPDAADTHVATWAWGDGTTSSGTVSEPAGDAPGHMAGHHVYAAPGVYTVTASVMDAGGLADERALRFVVVYDPDGGFVTGGGWIASPVGARPAAPSLTGKASFGFN
jgi:parallel beta-helix repeat protein